MAEATKGLQAIGAILVVLALLTIGQTFYFNNEIHEQRDCLESQIDELVAVLQQRAQLNEQETEAVSQIWAVKVKAAEWMNADGLQPLTKAQKDELRPELVAATLAYRDVLTEIKKQREENPVPAPPSGECDS